MTSRARTAQTTGNGNAVWVVESVPAGVCSCRDKESAVVGVTNPQWPAKVQIVCPLARSNQSAVAGKRATRLPFSLRQWIELLTL
jgi:hypothetical protein